MPPWTGGRGCDRGRRRSSAEVTSSVARADRKAILAHNTSSRSTPDWLRPQTGPNALSDIHFMNIAVPGMEARGMVARQIATEDQDFPGIAGLCRLRTSTKPITVTEDFPAFITFPKPAFWLPMINEAIYTLYEGVEQTVDAIDNGPMKLAQITPRVRLHNGRIFNRPDSLPWRSCRCCMIGLFHTKYGALSRLPGWKYVRGRLARPRKFWPGVLRLSAAYVPVPQTARVRRCKAKSSPACGH